MKTIQETLVLLYYRRPNWNDRELICVCESEFVARTHIKSLMEEYPDLYPTGERFEMNLVRYVREAY